MANLSALSLFHTKDKIPTYQLEATIEFPDQTSVIPEMPPKNLPRDPDGEGVYHVELNVIPSPAGKPSATHIVKLGAITFIHGTHKVSVTIKKEGEVVAKGIVSTSQEPPKGKMRPSLFE